MGIWYCKWSRESGLVEVALGIGWVQMVGCVWVRRVCGLLCGCLDRVGVIRLGSDVEGAVFAHVGWVGVFGWYYGLRGFVGRNRGVVCDVGREVGCCLCGFIEDWGLLWWEVGCRLCGIRADWGLLWWEAGCRLCGVTGDWGLMWWESLFGGDLWVC